jgi:enoyl-CoA hydratase/carnithine racemase
MESDRLRLVLGDGGRARLTPTLVHELASAIEGDLVAPLVTLEGTGGEFCVGLDLGALGSRGAVDLSGFARLLSAIEATPRPVVALVDGRALGGGVGIAAAADLVLASPRASFALPESLLGLIPSVVFPVLARRVGVPRARLLALGRRPLPASEALGWGLVDELGEDVERALAPYAARFSRIDRRAVGALKSLVAEHFTAREAYAPDAAARFLDLLESPETRARLARFASGGAPWNEEEPR